MPKGRPLSPRRRNAVRHSDLSSERLRRRTTCPGTCLALGSAVASAGPVGALADSSVCSARALSTAREGRALPTVNTYHVRSSTNPGAPTFAVRPRGRHPAPKRMVPPTDATTQKLPSRAALDLWQRHRFLPRAEPAAESDV